MSDLVGAEQYSAAQLREWLESLNLPKNGTKAAMAARLNEVPLEARGQGPPAADMCESESENEVFQNNPDSTKNHDASQHSNGEKKGETDNATSAIVSPTNDSYNNEPEAQKEQRKATDLANEIEALKLRIELLKLQKGGESENIPLCAGTSVNIESSLSRLNVAKDMLPNYHGNTSGNNSDVTAWIAQFRATAKINKLSYEQLLMLLMSKLKDNALMWLHSEVQHMSMPIDQLLNIMENTFQLKESKLSLRRKFESRSWMRDEEFVGYFNDKMMLASRIAIDAEELIDGIVEGIPDETLRRQAHMQCFVAPYQLLRAFEKVMLPKKYTPPGARSISGESSSLVRCYNCNSLGHMAVDCRKPKRERGACYGCGSMNHQIAHCGERKDKTASSTQGAQ
ncbi:uncharacterized protein LOC121404693 isoform X2 [Drosophila obscura]|uniref:uncharacterized protein LOC121404693 isoform X2 n=2 Tax=Drosophila obscura TaxID=7282 RepID=UPI001BB18B5B|nr:uncharacterized protein LOC121404693 isoform X2 [Drosophila obscura]